MRVEHVRAFLALAEELHFRRAAARLFVSQPTLTAQIHQLEHRLGVRLFERGPGGTRLTAHGHALLPAAREVERALTDLVSVPVERAGWRRGRLRLRIGLGPDGIGAATWPTLQALTARRPDLELTVTPLTFSTVLPALDRADVDAVLLRGPVDDGGGRRVVATVGCTARCRAPAPEPLARSTPRAHPRGGRPAHAGGTADVAVPSASGAVLRPLREVRWAPLQVVSRTWGPVTEDLVAVATEVVGAIGDLAIRSCDPRGADQQDCVAIGWSRSSALTRQSPLPLAAGPAATAST